MSAADLFRDAYDAEFRLKGTFIIIGREPYFINSVVASGSNDPKECLLIMLDMKGEPINVKLGRLPLWTMIACPSGWYDGTWFTRGPARHRYQGINGSCMWAVLPNGSIDSNGVGNVKTLLKELLTQPKTRRPGKRPSGAVTRDVYIGNSNVLVRGRLRGQYLGGNEVRPFGLPDPLTLQLFENAKLNVVMSDTPKEIQANPCAEIIL